MAGLSSFGGGGGLSASASSSARSGDASGGPLGLNIGGINTGVSLAPQGTGGSSSGIPAYVWIAALGLLAVIALKVLRK